jgi:hypothetical protein
MPVIKVMKGMNEVKETFLPALDILTLLKRAFYMCVSKEYHRSRGESKQRRLFGG